MSSLWDVMVTSYGDLRKRLAHRKMLKKADQMKRKGFTIEFIRDPVMQSSNDADRVSRKEVEADSLQHFTFLAS